MPRARVDRGMRPVREREARTRAEVERLEEMWAARECAAPDCSVVFVPSVPKHAGEAGDGIRTHDRWLGKPRRPKRRLPTTGGSNALSSTAFSGGCARLGPHRCVRRSRLVWGTNGARLTGDRVARSKDGKRRRTFPPTGIKAAPAANTAALEHDSAGSVRARRPAMRAIVACRRRRACRGSRCGACSGASARACATMRREYGEHHA